MRQSAGKIIAAFFLTLSVILIGGLLIMNAQEAKRVTAEEKPVTLSSNKSILEEYILEPVSEAYYEADPSVDAEVLGEMRAAAEDAAVPAAALTPGGRMSLINAADPYTYRVTPTVPGAVTISFAGDILMDPGYATMARMKKNGGTIEGVIDEPMLGLMRASDVMMVNNEFPFTDRGAPLQGKTFTFHGKTEWVKYLNDMGVDIAGLANNHTYDYGEIGLTDTLDTIRSAGIVTVGAGRNIAEASHPIYLKATDPVTKQDFTISIVAATQIERYNNPHTVSATETKPGVFRCYDVTALLEQVRLAKATSDYCIVFIHWGTERMVESDWAQNAQAPQIVEAGADLIIGAHPHILQKIEYIGTTPVVYSLGNYWFNSSTLNTCLITATITKDGLFNLQFTPAVQKNCTVSYADGEKGQQIIRYMNGLSKNAVIAPDGKITMKTAAGAATP